MTMEGQQGQRSLLKRDSYERRIMLLKRASNLWIALQTVWTAVHMTLERATDDFFWAQFKVIWTALQTYLMRDSDNDQSEKTFQKHFCVHLNRASKNILHGRFEPRIRNLWIVVQTFEWRFRHLKRDSIFWSAIHTMQSPIYEPSFKLLQTAVQTVWSVVQTFEAWFKQFETRFKLLKHASHNARPQIWTKLQTSLNRGSHRLKLASNFWSAVHTM